MTDAERSQPLSLRLATNTFVQIGGAGAASAVSFFTFIALTRGLGPEAYGDFVASLAFVIIATGVVDSGISNAIFREISAHPERTEAVMRASFPLRVLIAIASSVLMVAAGYALPFNDRTQLAIAIGAVGGFATLLYLGLLPVLQAQLRMHWAMLANVAGRLVTLGLTLTALAAGWGFTGVVWANVVGTAATLVVDFVVVARTVSLRPVIDLAYWRALTRGSLALTAAIGLGLVYFRMDTLVLALLVESREVGLYGAAFKFLELTELVVIAAGASVFPLLARFAATGDPAAQKVAQLTFELLLAAAAPLVVLMLVFPTEIIELTAGAEFATSAVVLQLLAPYVLFSFANGVLWRMLVAANRDRALVWIGAASLVARIGLLLLLVPLYGFRAAAVAAVAAEAISLALGAVAAWRTQRFLPRLGYLPAIVAAAAAMAAVSALTPLPAVLAAPLAIVTYVLLLVAVPGTVRETVGRLVRDRRAPATLR